jgi:hypothetical protein
MIRKEKDLSIRLIHTPKYIMWYIIFSMITTYLLFEIGEIKINPDESLFVYMLFNDALTPFISILLGGIINFGLPKNVRIKYISKIVLLKNDSRLKLWIKDFIILVLLACYTVTNRLVDVDIIISMDKFYLIPVLIFIAYFIKFLGWFMYKGLKDQILELIGIIILLLKSPGYLYQNMRREINGIPIHNKYKQVVLKPTKVICIMMVILICIMIVGIFFDTIKQYF